MIELMKDGEHAWKPIVWAYAGDELAPVILKVAEAKFVVLDTLTQDPFGPGMSSRWFADMDSAIKWAMELSGDSSWRLLQV